MLRGAGLRLHTLAQVYGVPADEGVADTEGLELTTRLSPRPTFLA